MTDTENKDFLAKIALHEIKEIPGLYLFTDFITEEEEKKLIEFIGSDGKWQEGPGRREVKQYGYEYNYKNKHEKTKKIADIPKEFKDIIVRMMKTKCFEEEPDQCIINKYEPGQGISAHTDHKGHFGNRVASLTLGSQCVMVMAKVEKQYDILLPRRSLLVLTGESRSDWTHAIPSRKSDNGVPRGTRISITLRNMLL